jgi:hypothetical protein
MRLPEGFHGTTRAMDRAGAALRVEKTVIKDGFTQILKPVTSCVADEPWRAERIGYRTGAFAESLRPATGLGG